MAGFDFLSVVDKKIADAANEAERLVDVSPKYSLNELREWFELVLKLLEDRHSIPAVRDVDAPEGKGPNQYRIDRLNEFGVNISESDIDALHAVRISTNKAAHAAEYPGFLTKSNAEVALDEAREVSKWLGHEYGKPRNVNAGNEASQTSTFDFYEALKVYGARTYDLPEYEDWYRRESDAHFHRVYDEAVAEEARKGQSASTGFDPSQLPRADPPDNDHDGQYRAATSVSNEYIQDGGRKKDRGCRPCCLSWAYWLRSRLWVGLSLRTHPPPTLLLYPVQPPCNHRAKTRFATRSRPPVTLRI